MGIDNINELKANMNFDSKLCEGIVFDRKGNFLQCKKKATHLEDPELLRHCDACHKEWMKGRTGTDEREL